MKRIAAALVLTRSAGSATRRYGVRQDRQPLADIARHKRRVLTTFARGNAAWRTAAPGLRGCRCGLGGAQRAFPSRLSTPTGNRSAGRQNALALKVGPKPTANCLTLGRPIALLQCFQSGRQIGINVKAVQFSL